MKSGGGSSEPPHPGASQAKTVKSVRQTLELPPPDAAVFVGAVQQDQRRTLARTLVPDPQARNLDGLHEAMLGRSRPWAAGTRLHRMRKSSADRDAQMTLRRPNSGIAGSFARRQDGRRCYGRTMSRVR